MYPEQPQEHSGNARQMPRYQKKTRQKSNFSRIFTSRVWGVRGQVLNTGVYDNKYVYMCVNMCLSM